MYPNIKPDKTIQKPYKVRSRPAEINTSGIELETRAGHWPCNSPWKKVPEQKLTM